MFYRTVFHLEVLSRGPLADGLTLERLAYAITDGDCSGNLTSESDEVDGPTMARLLRAQGSDPEFLGLNEQGVDTEQQEGDGT